MNQYITIELIIQCLSVLIGLFYAFKFFLVKDSQALKILALLFLILSYTEFFPLVIDFVNKDISYLLLPLFVAASISLAPTVYLYIRSVILDKKSFKKTHHFYPALLVLLIDVVLILLVRFVSLTPETNNLLSKSLLYLSIGSMAIIFVVQSIYYSIKSYQLITNHEAMIGDVVSFEEEISLKWLRVFLFGYLIFFTGTILVHFLDEEVLFFKNTFKSAFDLVVLLYLVYVGVNASKQISVQSVITSLSNKLNKPVDVDTIQKDKFELIKENLLKEMDSKKLYLNTSLTIFDLSKKLNTNYKYLSKIINSEFSMNFANFINSYRIEEAKLALKEPKTNHYKIEAIAEMVGFKSKSAFNGAFKKFVGKTPSEFRDS